MPTADDVANWMFSEVKSKRWLYQDDAAFTIERQFGTAFVYENDNGNTAIGKDVLKAFRKISSDDVVWESGEKAWRLREKHDTPGRQQN
ncbi:hypothetical protein [Magnetospirillum sp. 64-120]|uniref:DUF6953 family protein n=1 Tax=Magnetospirillum sp. 64-120 TaxID=1895778 RepID=UPI00092A1DDD|nr:hypothetical protein [Magnetospirillum sp. 64-120]OJX65816.1 MAG: hypothetical protein BGO92_06895 [Magnetospirillum sp. 64-120]